MASSTSPCSPFQYEGERNVYISIGSYTNAASDAGWSGPLGEAQQCPPAFLRTAIEDAKNGKISKIILIDPNFNKKVECIDNNPDLWKKVGENRYLHRDFPIHLIVVPHVIFFFSNAKEEALIQRMTLNDDKSKMAILDTKVSEYVRSVLNGEGKVLLGEFANHHCMADKHSLPSFVDLFYNQIKDRLLDAQKNNLRLIAMIFSKCTDKQSGQKTNALCVLDWGNQLFDKRIQDIFQQNMCCNTESLEERLSRYDIEYRKLLDAMQSELDTGASSILETYHERVADLYQQIVVRSHSLEERLSRINTELVNLGFDTNALKLSTLRETEELPEFTFG